MEEVTDIWEQVQAVNLSSLTTEKEIEEIQSQPGSDLVRIRSHVLADTIPEECELEQSSGEFKNLATLVPKMRLHLPFLQVWMSKQHRELWVVVCPLQPLTVWEAHQMYHARGNRTMRRAQLDWFWSGINAACDASYTRL